MIRRWRKRSFTSAMEELDKLVIDRSPWHDNTFAPVLSKAPQIIPNIKYLTVFAPLVEFPALTRLRNLRYIKVHFIDFLIENRNLSLPTVTQFIYLHGSVEKIYKLATVLQRLFPNLQTLGSYFWGNDEAVDQKLALPESCTTVQVTSEVADLFSGCAGIKHFAVDGIHPGKTTKRIFDMSSEFETLILMFSGNLEETFDGLVPDILRRFNSLKFLQIFTVRIVS